MPQLDKNSILLRCAYLRYRKKLQIQDISRRLEISRFRVSRYLREAEERGIVEIRINDLPNGGNTLAGEIERKFGARRVEIVPVSRYTDSTLSKKVIGEKGAELLTGSPREISIGISWGRTIAYMVEELPDASIKASRISELTGGLGMIGVDLPTSALASLFAKKTGAACYQMPGPIIAGNSEVASNLLADDSLDRTLESARTCDLAVCGLAPLNRDSLLHLAGLLTEDEFDELRSMGAVGSVIGRFFDRNGNEITSRYSKRAIAVELDDFRRIPERIILVGGRGKTACAAGALAGNLATTYVMDDITAAELLRDFG